MTLCNAVVTRNWIGDSASHEIGRVRDLPPYMADSEARDDIYSRSDLKIVDFLFFSINWRRVRGWFTSILPTYPAILFSNHNLNPSPPSLSMKVSACCAVYQQINGPCILFETSGMFDERLSNCVCGG